MGMALTMFTITATATITTSAMAHAFTTALTVLTMGTTRRGSLFTDFEFL
jgi:hypothetical protein